MSDDMSVTTTETVADAGSVIEAPYEVTGPVEPKDTPEDAPEAPKIEAKDEPEAKDESEAKAESENKPEDNKPEENPDVKKASEASRNEANDVLTQKGLDMAEFEKEYTVNGDLSEDSLAKLEKAGIPRAMVQAYIDGQKALVDTFVSDVKSLAGGDEGYKSVVEWAKQNLSEEEKASYDRVMFSGDKQLIKMAVHSLVSRYNEAEGIEPEVHIMGKAPARASSNVRGFKNMSEMKAAMRDPRYGRDPDYTREVELKTMKATFM